MHKLLLTLFIVELLFFIAAPKTANVYAIPYWREEDLINLKVYSSPKKLSKEVCLPAGAFFLDQIKSAKHRRKVLEETLKHSYDAYVENGWMLGKSVNYFNTRHAPSKAFVNLKVILDAMNTFKLLGMTAYYHKAAHYINNNLPKKFKTNLYPSSLNLFPSLVTAYHLTRNMKFYNHAIDIAFNEVRHLWPLWPLEAAILFSPNRQARVHFFDQLESKFETLFDDTTYDRSSVWKHYWMLVNLYRYSNFTASFTMTKFNTWLNVAPKTNEFHGFHKPKLFTTKRWPKLLYISIMEGSMNSADCAWGATLAIASQIMIDSVIIGKQTIPQKEFVWSEAKLLNTALNITETCRLGAAVSSKKLPLNRMKFDEDLEDKDDVMLKKVSEIVHNNQIRDYSSDIVFGDSRNNVCEPSSRTFRGEPFSSLSTVYHITSAGNYKLQSQLALSYFIAYRVTRNEYYREFAWEHFLAMVERCQLDPRNSYASMAKNEDNEYGLVGVLKYHTFPSEQVSVFFGEIMRYLYLTFDDIWMYPLQKYIFTENGNVFPIEE